MLRITIEVVPHGQEERSFEVGKMLIANDLTGNRNSGNYEVAVEADSWTGQSRQFTNITKFDRTKGSWALLHRALTKLFRQGGSSKKNRIRNLLADKLDSYEQK